MQNVSRIDYTLYVVNYVKAVFWYFKTFFTLQFPPPPCLFIFYYIQMKCVSRKSSKLAKKYFLVMFIFPIYSLAYFKNF